MDITSVINIDQLINDDEIDEYSNISTDNNHLCGGLAFISISLNLAARQYRYRTIVLTEGLKFVGTDKIYEYIRDKGIFLDDEDSIFIVYGTIRRRPYRAKYIARSILGGPCVKTSGVFQIKTEKDRPPKRTPVIYNSFGYLVAETSVKEILNGHGLDEYHHPRGSCCQYSINSTIHCIDRNIAFILSDRPISYLYINFSKTVIDNVTFEGNDCNPTHIILYFTDAIGDKFVIRISFDLEIKYPDRSQVRPSRRSEAAVEILSFEELNTTFRRLPILNPKTDELTFVANQDHIYRLDEYLKTPDHRKRSIPYRRFVDIGNGE